VASVRYGTKRDATHQQEAGRVVSSASHWYYAVEIVTHSIDLVR